ncbi:Family of serine hydrolases 1 [Spathaspora sp. JA1]|nr:Family of serine hydrolases 1 [Spathaspora sp. JA1]
MTKKILCLPGFLQNGSTFAAKSSGIRKQLTKKLDLQLDYLDPPQMIASKDKLSFPLGATEPEAQQVWESVVSKGNNRCWWDHQGPGINVGLAESIEYVIKHIDENGPYDGIIGFSQGAAMSMMVTNCINKLLPSHGPFKVALLVSCFCLTEPRRPEDSRDKINNEIVNVEEFKQAVKITNDTESYSIPPSDLTTKMIFVHGSSDSVVTPIRSKYAESLYQETRVRSFVHDGGHLMPNQKQFIEPIIRIFNEELFEKSML